MAGEHTLVTELEPPVSFTCADGTGIEKGTLLKLTDPMTAIATSGAGDAIAGVAAAEKIANDGNTKIPDFAVLLQFTDSLFPLILIRPFIIPDMELLQIDIIPFQITQAAFRHRDNMVRRKSFF